MDLPHWVSTMFDKLSIMKRFVLMEFQIFLSVCEVSFMFKAAEKHQSAPYLPFCVLCSGLHSTPQLLVDLVMVKMATLMLKHATECVRLNSKL